MTGDSTATVSDGVLEVVGGLPTHVLVLHAAIVLVPLAALATLLVVLSPIWSRRVRWAVVTLAAVATASVFLAVESGQALQDRFGIAADPLVAEHAELGSEARWWVLGFLVLLVLWAVLEQRSGAGTRPGPGEPGDDAPGADPDPLAPSGALHRLPYGWVRFLGVVVLLLGLTATVAVWSAGHAGTRAVWEAQVDATR